MRVREVVEDVSIEDGDCPFAGVRPKAGSGGNVEVFSVIWESDVLQINPTTDSVSKGDIGSTGLRGGERREVGVTLWEAED